MPVFPHLRLSVRVGRCLAAASCLLLLTGTAVAQGAGASLAPAAVVPAAGPWLVRDSGHFRFIHRERDNGFVRDLEACADGVYRTVTGFWGYAPAGPVTVVIRGDQDSPPFGGGTIPFPLRIEIVTGTGYSAKTLLQHEFTHYVNATLPSGFFGVIAAVFGRDLGIAQLGVELHLLEGVTSLLDGDRTSPANEVLYKAPIIEQRMWAEPDIWSGGRFMPGALRVYVSQLIVCDWIYRHYGPAALADIQADFARFPILGDGPAIARLTGLDSALVWSRALRELAERFAADRALPAGTLLTPQSSATQRQWRMHTQTARGFLMTRQSLDSRPEMGFWIPPAADPAATGPRLDRPEESGEWFPFTGLAGADNGQGVSADGRLVVAAIPEPVFGSDINKANGSDLWLYHPQPDAAGRGYSGKALRLTRDAHLFDPCISPDGRRIFAAQRVSDRFRLVEVDPAGGAVSVLLDLDDGLVTSRVTGIAVSPDGRRLALSVINDDASDIALADLPAMGQVIDSAGLRWLTRDAANEYAPRWLADGRLVFASDRENAIVVYACDPAAEGPLKVSRLLREPVAAWSGDFEAASYLRPDGSPAAVSATGAEPRFIYNSYTSEGRAVKRIAASLLDGRVVDGFAGQVPDYRARQAEREAVFQVRSPVAAGQTAAVSAAAPLVDPAVPCYWMPVAGYDATGLSLGLATSAFSLLGQNSWEVSASWVPDGNQLTGYLAWNLLLPELRFTLKASQNYTTWPAGDGSARWGQQRRLLASAGFDLAEWWTPTDFRSTLGLNAAAATSWQATSNQAFDAVAAWSLATDFDVIGKIGLDWTAWAPWPAQAIHGGAVAKAWVDLVAMPWNTRIPAAQGLVDLTLRGGLEGRLPLDSAYLGLRLRSAWSQSGSAAGQLDQLGVQWLVPQAPLRFDLRLDFALPDRLRQGERLLYFFALEESGLRLLAQSGAGVDRAGTIRWDGNLQLGLELLIKPIFYLNPIPFRVGGGVNLHIADGNPVFSAPGDLSLWLGINGQQISLADPAGRLP